ncbi:MAG TPA: TMEM175 family protein [Verrucomicrobiae bacterium]|jgi:uncharacterized membrane protein|nr:TMEM175 family protein [Verrucomicrobiae bacterium]
MQSETSRIEAFSDGVFAIAITLLILEVKVPASPQGGLGAALLRQWPSYVGFLLSFAFIGIMWMSHHRMFTLIKRTNDTLLVLNLLLLLGVTVVPFPTAVLAVHLGGPEEKTAAVLYNATFVIIGIMFNILWRYAVARRLIDPSALRSAASMSRQYAFGPIVYLICLALAWVSVKASLALSIGIAIFFALPPGLLVRRK